MKKKELEKRSYNCEVRTIDTEKEGVRTLTGRPIVYNSRTDLYWFDEIIEPGALDGADLTDVRFLVNHDLRGIPLARSRNNNMNSTLRLMPNEYGLDFESDVDVKNNARASELASAVDRGDISGMSFMFSVDDEEWEDLQSDHPTRRIKKIGSVIEISAVTFPAYDDTEIHARDKEALENARATLENVRQRDNKSLESEKEQLELEKLKIKILTA
jgi:HK97 family phage prohead protease